jgi:SpoVK/Ycf46/Vps4 family AAA+-type ATPase
MQSVQCETHFEWQGGPDRLLYLVFKNKQKTKTKTKTKTGKIQILIKAKIFFDEIDAIVAKRELGSTGGEGVQSRVLSTMLNEMDGIEQAEGILVIVLKLTVMNNINCIHQGATNRLDMIDPALIRPGRFDKVLSVCFRRERRGRD